MEAIRYYKKSWQQIDLIILDMIMPGMDGRETYFKIREINPLAKVIVFSGFSHDEKVQKLIIQGVRGYIQKPFTSKEMSHKIEQVMSE